MKVYKSKSKYARNVINNGIFSCQITEIKKSLRIKDPKLLIIVSQVSQNYS